MTAGVYAEISSDGQSIVLAVTGDDHELNAAGAALRRLTPLLKPTDPKGFLLAPLTWACVCQLSHTFSSELTGRWLPQARLQRWVYDEFLRRAASAQQPAEVPQPAAAVRQTAKTAKTAASDKQLAIELEPAAREAETATGLQPAAVPSQPARGLVPRPYQLDGARMIAAAGKFLLFDEAGTGKTISTLLGLRLRQEQGHELFPLVVVVPSWDVADVWARHIRDWAPGWPEPVLYGGPERCIYKDSAAGEGQTARVHQQVLLTTYATARIDGEPGGPLVKLRAKTVVLDEAHYCRNTGAKRTQAVTRVAAHAGSVVALTGTPVTRDTGDIYPVLAAMDPASFPSRERFAKRYLLTSEDGYGETVEGLDPRAEPEFRAVLMGQYRRVAKADVLDQLPPKVYSVRRVELPAEWRRAYDSLERDMLAELPDGGELPVMSVLAQLTRLSQLASSACDVEIVAETDPETGEERKRYEVTPRAPSWKADALLGVLAERPGQQAVVFTVSRQLALVAGAACQEAGYRTGYLLGGMSARSRQDGIAGFQAGGLDVLVATAGAGSLGITLTAAGTAVFLQRSWQLDQAVQAEDRLHRIGQRHGSVEVIDVIARDTVDERVRALLREKGGQLAKLVQDERLARELLGGLR